MSIKTMIKDNLKVIIFVLGVLIGFTLSFLLRTI